jgi:hypothetical protein
MKSFFTELINLTDKEKAEIFLMMILVLLCTCFILLAIVWSRSNEVEYFRKRVILMDQRMTVIDKKLHDTQQNTDATLDETRRLLEFEINRSNENDRWIEYWKTIPQHQPKNQQKK